jgi:AraC-like DNA-binding protein
LRERGSAVRDGLSSAGILDRPPSEWPESIRLSTDDLPEARRLAWFREFLGRQVMRQEFDAPRDQPFYTDVLMRRLPGLVIYWTTSSPRTIRRTRELLSDGNDNLLFQCGSGARQVEHLGREVFVGPGAGIVFSCAETRTLRVDSDYQTVSLSVPRSALGFRLQDADACVARPLPRESPAQQLLLGYLELLRNESSTSTLELREAAVHHIHDLLAISLGATRDAAEIAKKRGVRAARLHTIKSWIRERLVEENLSISSIAAAHRLTPRYVQMLFDSEGTTFTEFVRDERLARAYRILLSPRSGERKIADIALACGFGDISTFNRRFRARFGASPSDIRSPGGHRLPRA